MIVVVMGVVRCGVRVVVHIVVVIVACCSWVCAWCHSWYCASCCPLRVLRVVLVALGVVVATARAGVRVVVIAGVSPPGGVLMLFLIRVSS